MPFDHVVLKDHVTKSNHCISNTTVLMATKLGRMATYLQVVLQSDKQRPLYLHYQSTYGNQIWQDDDLP